MSGRSARCFSAAWIPALVCAIVLGPALCSAASAIDYWPFFRKPAPQPRMHPVQTIPHDVHARISGYAVPSYPWGYFGAIPGPSCISTNHRGYYNEYVQWGWRPRY